VAQPEEIAFRISPRTNIGLEKAPSACHDMEDQDDLGFPHRLLLTEMVASSCVAGAL